jgi:hypothetical protein
LFVLFQYFSKYSRYFKTASETTQTTPSYLTLWVFFGELCRKIDFEIVSLGLQKSILAVYQALVKAKSSIL